MSTSVEPVGMHVLGLVKDGEAVFTANEVDVPTELFDGKSKTMDFADSPVEGLIVAKTPDGLIVKERAAQGFFYVLARTLEGISSLWDGDLSIARSPALAAA